MTRARREDETGTTASGVPIDKERGQRAVTAEPHKEARMAVSGSPDQLETVTAEEILGRDGTERQLNTPIDEELNREVEVAVVKKYVVERGGMIVANGARTRIAEGKIIDTLNYDVPKLKQQGIKMREATAEDIG